MAQIRSVAYEGMPGRANEIRTYGKELNSEITKIYATVGKMHDSWYGKRYNELVKAFNNMIASLNEMLKLVVTDVPYALETIANNYAQADIGQNVTVANNEAPNKLLDIAITEDMGMKFLTENVKEAQQEISKCFANAKEQMNKIESVYAKIEWQSEAADKFKTTFTKLKNDIVTSFENINTEFTNKMNQTQDDIERAEKANTVN